MQAPPFGTGHLCGMVTGPTPVLVEAQREQLTHLCDLVEIRADLLTSAALQRLPQLLGTFLCPTLLTWRSREHGGAGDRPWQRWRALAALQPSWLDLEWEWDDDAVREVQRLAPSTRLLRSLHGVRSDDLPALGPPERWPSGDLWKICPTTPTAREWAEANAWWQAHRSTLAGRCIWQPQGPLGIIQRLWGDRWSQPWTYLPVEATAPGQITCAEWQRLYHCCRRRHRRRLYGVVGHPVRYSMGPYAHNAWMAACGWEGAYAALQVEAEGWPQAWSWLREHSSGLAVTTPLKEVVARSLDHLSPEAKEAHSVSAVVFPEGGPPTGVDVDGAAAASLCQRLLTLTGARAVVLGAGGTARAIACALSRSGSQVTLLSRTPPRHAVAPWVPPDQWPVVGPAADLIVQATSCGWLDEGMPVDPRLLRPGQVVLEAIQRDTPFASLARQRGCAILEGREMFIELSALQAELWSGGVCSREEGRHWIEEAVQQRELRDGRIPVEAARQSPPRKARGLRGDLKDERP